MGRDSDASGGPAGGGSDASGGSSGSESGGGEGSSGPAGSPGGFNEGGFGPGNPGGGIAGNEGGEPAEKDHVGIAASYAQQGRYGDALGALGLAALDAFGGFVAGKALGTIGTAVGMSLAGPLGAATLGVLGSILGSKLGKPAAHAAHSSVGVNTGSVGTNAVEGDGEYSAEHVWNLYRESVDRFGEEDTLKMIAEAIADTDTAKDPKVYAKKRQYQNIIGSAHLAAYNLIV